MNLRSPEFIVGLFIGFMAGQIYMGIWVERNKTKIAKYWRNNNE